MHFAHSYYIEFTTLLMVVRQPAACTPFYAFIKWIYWSNFSLYLCLWCCREWVQRERRNFDMVVMSSLYFIVAWHEVRVALHLFVALMKSPYWGRCDFGVNVIRHRWHWPLFPSPPSTSCWFVTLFFCPRLTTRRPQRERDAGTQCLVINIGSARFFFIRMCDFVH